jgi:hypothetical protein
MCNEFYSHPQYWAELAALLPRTRTPSISVICTYVNSSLTLTCVWLNKLWKNTYAYLFYGVFTYTICRVMLQATDYNRLDSGLPDFSWSDTKWIQNVPNGHKIYQISTKYSKWPLKYIDISQSKTLQNLPKFEFFVLKQTIRQPWLDCF